MNEAISGSVEAGLWYGVASRAVSHEEELRAENARLRGEVGQQRWRIAQLQVELDEVRRKHAAAVVRTLREPRDASA